MNITAAFDQNASLFLVKYQAPIREKMVHIEVRSLDINPFLLVGLDEEQAWY
jgi:gamma-glutamylcysteine synthetase